MLKVLQARLQKYMNQELLDVLAGFRKGRGIRDKIVNICWIIEKGNSRKIPTFASLTLLQPLPVCSRHSVMSNSLRHHRLQPTRLLCPWGFSCKSNGVGCHALLQGIFPTQGLNLHLQPCRWILY